MKINQMTNAEWQENVQKLKLACEYLIKLAEEMNVHVVASLMMFNGRNGEASTKFQADFIDTREPGNEYVNKYTFNPPTL